MSGDPRIELGDFVIEGPLGKGGMGNVWRGRHVELAVPAALKVLEAEPGEAFKHRMFDREIRAMARLRHPGIVQIYDHGTVSDGAAELSGGVLTPGAPWYAMELADGGSLADLGVMTTWPELKVLLRLLLRALAHAHAHRVLHRDLKPGNVLLAGPGSHRPGPRLSDFGLAWLARADDIATDHTAVAGTPAFMAPEQLRPDPKLLGPWTDLFALAGLAFQLTTGELPRAQDLSWAFASGGDWPELQPFQALLEVPSGFEGWLRRLMAFDPEGRPRSASEAERELFALDGARPPPPGWQDPGTENEAFGHQVASLRMLSLRDPPLVGRRSEKRLLWALLDQALSRQGVRGAVLQGAPGTGKSRLARWLATRAEEFGVAWHLHAVHSAKGSPRDGLPAMVRRALNLETVPPKELAASLEAELARRKLPAALNEALLAAIDPTTDSEHREVMPALRAFLEALSAQQTVVLWLDEVQHGPDSLTLVETLLLPPLKGLPIFVVMTAGPGGHLAASLAIKGLERHAPRVRHIDLKPLPPFQVDQLVGTVGTLPAHAVEAIRGASAGNPGAVLERMRARLLVDDHGLDSPVTADLEDLDDLWRQRVSRFLAGHPDHVERLLGAAALLGTEGDVSLLHTICEGLMDPEPEAGLLALARDGLLHVDADSWTFQHESRRQAAEEHLRSGWSFEEVAAAVSAALAEDARGPSLARAGRLRIELGDRAGGAVLLLEAATAWTVEDLPHAAAEALSEAEKLIPFLGEPALAGRALEVRSALGHKDPDATRQ